MSARTDRHALRRGVLLLACVLLSWTFAVTMLLAILRVLPVTAGDMPDHTE